MSAYKKLKNMVSQQTHGKFTVFLSFSSYCNGVIAEKMTFKISPEGIVSLVWGEKKMDFFIYDSK